MKKIILITTLILSSILGNITQIATDNCPIYNNMKHTKNSGDQSLKIGSSYRVIDEKRGQYYITIKGISVPNRWVDRECFAKSQKRVEDKKVVKKSKNISNSPKMLLALSWQNAFCETHRYLKECKSSRKSYTDTKFGLHGLWPQPRENIYCSVSKEDRTLDKRRKWRKLSPLNLSETTRRELLEVMPSSKSSYLQRHEWIKHGTCANMSQDDYYNRAINLTKQINNSKVGQFFAQNIGKVVKLQQIRFKMNESFGRGASKKLELRCKDGLITEIWLYLSGDNSDDITTLLKNGKEVRSRCTKGKIDRVGF